MLYQEISLKYRIKKKFQNLKNEVGICIKAPDGKHNTSNVTNERF